MKKKEVPPERRNPFISAKRVWNDYLAAEISSRNWLIITVVFSLVIAMTAACGLIYTAGLSKFIPYVVQVDKTGNTAYYGTLQPAGDGVSSDLIIRTLLSDFISEARSVTPDLSVQRSNIFRLYAKMNSTDPAFIKINEYMRASATNPFERSRKEMVNVEITAILQQSKESYQVEWIESVRTRGGDLISKDHMKALVTIYQIDTAKFTDPMLRVNPIGMYVQNISWAKL